LTAVDDQILLARVIRKASEPRYLRKYLAHRLEIDAQLRQPGRLMPERRRDFRQRAMVFSCAARKW
jgi:hypothetical protein